MKVLVLGATGMLGHQVYQYLKNGDTEAVGTCREFDTRVQKRKYGQTFCSLDILDGHWGQQLLDILTIDGPFDYIINCIGLIKPIINEKSPSSVAHAIRINAQFPHHLSVFAGVHGGKVIHPSTDCVFSGNAGRSYKENDLPDATDVYGRTKILGECPANMNIRTSIVGPEINTQKSLLEWFLNCQDEEVNGFINHHWNGMTTLQWTKLVFNIMRMDRWKAGVRHFYSLPVSKADLLMIFKKEFARVNRKTPKINPVSAPQDKWMLLRSNYPTYVMQFEIPSLVEQVRELVVTRYGGG